MRTIPLYALTLVLFCLAAGPALALQAPQSQLTHKVKRHETIFGIARSYGLTIDQLTEANPQMKVVGYELKKGETLVIPQAPARPATAPATAAAPKAGRTAAPSRHVRIGVFLPLHDINGDGRRMTEYYRGVLMAADSMRHEGISTDIYAWNAAEDADVDKLLKDKNAQSLDFIIGPLYSKQVPAVAAHAKVHGQKVLIPFSIEGAPLAECDALFQVYQSPADWNEEVVSRYLQQFAGCHTVIIDCNDTTSRKGVFTLSLRRRLEQTARTCSVTNIRQTEANFRKAFRQDMPNVVVLNTARSPELNVVFAKLEGMRAAGSAVKVTLFGYTEWMMYAKYQMDNFYRYSVYIPAAFHTNSLSGRTARLEQKYRWAFHDDMMAALPRFAITGFDHACYIIKGFTQYGAAMTGAPGTVAYTPAQSPLKFRRVGKGGYQNKCVLLVHYMPEGRVETLQ